MQHLNNGAVSQIKDETEIALIHILNCGNWLAGDSYVLWPC